jgi:hypothetical protein
MISKVKGEDIESLVQQFRHVGRCDMTIATKFVAKQHYANPLAGPATQVRTPQGDPVSPW